MKPISFKDAFAAGAAYGAAKDAGMSPEQQAHAAIVAEEVFKKKPEDVQKSLDGAHSSSDTDDDEVKPPRKPRRQLGPGLLLRLAHWLKLK